MKRLFVPLILVCLFFSSGHSQKILIQMDLQQTDHLKAYGLAFWILQKNVTVEWLLNYRGGSFLVDYYAFIERECRVRGISFEITEGAAVRKIYAQIEQENMDSILLEKAPSIAIYAPPNKQAWDDAVLLALEYAEIPYSLLWDEEVLNGELQEYDWLHLHHEDFTGQYGKFYANYRNTDWYQDEVKKNSAMARQMGFQKVSDLKKAVALTIRDYMASGGFVFAMCSATDTIDIALAALNTDIVASVFDGDPVSGDAQQKLDYTQCLAFTDFKILPDPLVYEYSDIDIPPSYSAPLLGAEAEYFSLFEFSAKYDPVPTMLTQNHVSVIKGFMGQTTGFRKELIKTNVLIMGESEGTQQVKYIHGNYGKGTYTFLGGHDPEDYQHYVNDPPTELELHKTSPGYRLILNNILFPAARKKKLKT
ncbi:asparagine synthetase B [candidate division KSB1 bacterium]|nr:asparagine synthetase B [candidate division KSB1 bacterium]